MSSLTTMLAVGPEEYVEFNESMGSKAFLEHVWDQRSIPLNTEETSASGSQLHSVGIRISPEDPPRIEFPTVHRIKGKGNTYKSTGRWISWQDLKQKNPAALIDPPSLEEFMKRGGKIGIGEKIEPGALRKAEKRFKVVKRKKDPVKSTASAPDDSWVGGSSQSIYATNGPIKSRSNDGPNENIIASGSNDGYEEPDQDGWIGGEVAPISRARLVVGKKPPIGDPMQSNEKHTSAAAPSRPLRKSRSGLSLSERLGMDSLKEASKAEPMPNYEPEISANNSSTSQKGSKREQPPKLGLLDQVFAPAINSLQFSEAQTPLSATHSPSETPLKYMWRGENKRNDLPITPGNELAVHNATLNPGSARMGGLLLDPGEGAPVLPRELQTPKRETIALTMTSSTADDSTTTKQSQIDQMLAKVRQARSRAGAGIQESRWAVKETDTANQAVGTLAKEEKPPVDEPPSAPRALREARALEKQPKSQSTASKSLLERMGSIVIEDQTTEKPTKPKKEKKRESKKDMPRHKDEERGSSPPALQREDDKDQIETTTVLSQEEAPSAKLDHQVPSSDSQTNDNGPPPSSSLLAPSISASSVFTEAITEGSNVGNDTFTSINWADSDDDELPDLPEEWIKASQIPMDSSETKRSSSDYETPPAQDTIERPDPEISANTQRGPKKGGKGRSKKEREDGAPRGLRIAGSAAQASRQVTKAAASKELFPLHKSDASVSNGSKAHRKPQSKEQRPHGRPKLVTNNGDAFSRLTKGALGATSSGQGEPRNQRQTTGGTAS